MRSISLAEELNYIKVVELALRVNEMVERDEIHLPYRASFWFRLLGLKALKDEGLVSDLRVHFYV